MFKIHKLYNFSTIVPAILGDTYKNMKVVARMSHQEAVKKRDIFSLHDQVKRSLPQDIAVRDMEYILFEDPSGSELVLPIEYIATESIIEVKRLKLLVEIPDANTEDVAVIQEVLISLGHFGCKLELKSY